MAKGQGKVILEKQGDIHIVQIVNKQIREESVVNELGAYLLGLLDKGSAMQIVVDLSEVQSMSSKMIGAMVAFKKKGDRHKARIKLAGLKDSLLEIFKITRMDDIFEFAADRAAAVKSFESQGFRLRGR